MITWLAPYSGWELIFTAIFGFVSTAAGVLGALALDRSAQQRRDARVAVGRAVRLVEEIRARHFTEELTEAVGVNFAMENPTPMTAAKDDIVAELVAVSPAASSWFALEILLRDSRKTVVRLGTGKEIELKQLD